MTNMTRDRGMNPEGQFHFLLVEDDQTHADLIRFSLESHETSCTLSHVVDGAAAVAFMRQEGKYADTHKPHVVLLDLNLPKLNGLEVLEIIKSDPDLQHTPVIVLTTSASEGDRSQAYLRHANSFLTKPLDFGLLQKMMADVQRYWTQWNQPLTTN